MAASGNTGQLYQKLVSGDTFNIAQVLNDQSNKMIERMNIECNTSGGSSGITIQLPTVQQLDGLLNFEVVITDTGNNAAIRNITILPGSGNTINKGASLVIATNKGGAFFILGTQSDWAAFSTANLTSSGGVGTVTSFTAGNLTPLFTCSVSTATTTPALTFTLANAETNFVFAGPASGVAAPPTFRSLVKADFLRFASATLNFPLTAPRTSSDLTIALTGAVVGDPVMLGIPAVPDANSCYTAWVSAEDVVTVRFNNYTDLGINPGSASFTVFTIKSA
jgi:hypothetical protein